MTSPYLELLVRQQVALEAIQRIRSRLEYDGRSAAAKALRVYEEEARSNLDKAIDGAVTAACEHVP